VEPARELVCPQSLRISRQLHGPDFAKKFTEDDFQIHARELCTDTEVWASSAERNMIKRISRWIEMFGLRKVAVVMIC